LFHTILNRNSECSS